MASRALTPRLRITCSTWFGSARTRPLGRRRPRLQVDVLADDPPQDLLEVAHQRVEVDDARLEHLLAAEGQELVRHRRRLPARLLDHLDVAGGWFRRGRAASPSSSA